jgi:hypothetical protein
VVLEPESNYDQKELQRQDLMVNGNKGCIGFVCLCGATFTHSIDWKQHRVSHCKLQIHEDHKFDKND